MEKVSKEEFVVRAIGKLRKPPYKGIHSVYSGFYNAFRQYYNEDPVPVVKTLESKGVVVTKPVKGGVMIYIASEAPNEMSSQDIVRKILE